MSAVFAEMAADHTAGMAAGTAEMAAELAAGIAVLLAWMAGPAWKPLSTLFPESPDHVGPAGSVTRRMPFV